VHWVKGGGVCGHAQKSEAHALGCKPRGESANEAAIYPKLTGLCQREIVSGILKKWKQCGTVLNQLWVPGRSRGHGRPYLSFLTRNSATVQFQVLMNMQMDAYLKKGQIGTLFVHVGLLHGGSRGGWVGQGGPDQF